MRKAKLKRVDGGEDEINVYNIHEFPFDKLNKKALICKHHTAPKYIIYSFGTFDIETTTVLNSEGTPNGFMYHWQMDVAGHVCTGRTWEEWTDFMIMLVEFFETDVTRHLVIYVHNLAFEFQFMRDFLIKYLDGFKVFASQKRKPIYVTTGKGIEFRCSYKLTNMSLEKAVENELGVVHIKASGDLDYRVCRTAVSELNDIEFAYCVADVVCLYELIERRLYNEHDDLESIPMTSTGYVRRDCRNACRKDPHYREDFLKMEMYEDVYVLLCEASRGGNTHANRYMSGRIWHDADSFDVQSSYPAQMFMRKFPMTKFTPYGEVESVDELNHLMSEYACLFRVIFTGMRVRDYAAMPYIALDKAWAHSKHIALDNGRVLSTIEGKDRGFIALTITDVDFSIINEQYEWDELSISDMHIADYDYLPMPLLEQIMTYFKFKSELKYDINEKEQNNELDDEYYNLQYLYAKSKNRLNGIFGMCYTNPVRNKIYINEEGKWKEDTPDIASALAKFWKNRNSFLVYAWGVWVTAWARRHLEDLFNAMSSSKETGQHNVIYGDTDSGKGVNIDLSKIDALNEKIKAIADERGAYCDYKGVRYYMGIYEHENKKPIAKFKTLGAKKYVYEDERGLHVTISGVNKEKGASELGSIDNFKPGFIFKEAGGLTLYYNDSKEGICQITINGCTMTTASNIGMVDSTYEIGITGEYAELIGYNVYLDVDKDIF